MGMVGCLGDIVFTVSDRTIETINNVTWSGSARYATHQRHGTHALTEFTGLDPDKIGFCAFSRYRSSISALILSPRL